MHEEFDGISGKNILTLVQQFQETVDEKATHFFDIDDLAEVIDYYIGVKDFYKAGRASEYALEQYPESLLLLTRKAQVFALTNKTTKALQLLTEIEEVDPSNAEIYMIKGDIYSMTEEPEQALEQYNKFLENTEVNEADDNIYLKIGLEYEHLEDYEKALETFKKSYKLNPDNEFVLSEIFYCCDQTDRLKEYVKYVLKVIERKPYFRFGWFSLGLTYTRLELYEKALDAYDYAIAIDENFMTAYFNKANVLANLKRYQEAIEVYKTVLSQDAADALTYYYIGECYEKLDNIESAIENYKKATEIDENFADAWMGTGELLYILNQTNEGFRYMKKALDICPDNSEYWYIIGEAQSNSKLYKEAIESFQNVCKFDETNQEIWLDYSDVYAQLNDFDQAVEIISQGIEKYPENAELRYRLAAYLINHNQSKEAYNQLEKALHLDYDKHTAFLEYLPELKNDATMLEFIELNKK